MANEVRCSLAKRLGWKAFVRFVLGASCLFLLLQPASYSQETDKNGKPPAFSLENRIGIVTSKPSVDESMLMALRNSGLDELAISRCELALARTSPGSMERARWTAWLVETLALRDTANAPTIQAAMQNARTTGEKFLADPVNKTQSIWIESALIRIELLVAQRAVTSYLAAPSNQSRREDVLEALRRLSDAIEKIEPKVKEQMGEASRKSRRDETGLVSDLMSLRNRLLLMQVDSMLLRSNCYPQGSNEAMAAGGEALTAIDKASEQIDAQWEGRPELELAKIAALNALTQFDESHRLAESIFTRVKDPTVLVKAGAMAARAARLSKNSLKAAQWIEKSMALPTNGVPELALEQLESKIATTGADQQAIVEVLDLKKQIGERFGKYWELRAEAAIVSNSSIKLPRNDGTTTTPANDATHQSNNPVKSSAMEIIKLQIKQKIAGSDFDGAIKDLEQAEAIAYNAKELDEAFRYSKTAIGLTQKKLASIPEASTQLRKSTRDSLVERTQATAVKYRLLSGAEAIYQIAIDQIESQLTEATTGARTQELNGRLESLLLERTEHWPSSSDSRKIRYRLQRLYLVTNRNEDLLKLWSDAVDAVKTSKLEGVELAAYEDFASIGLLNAILTLEQSGVPVDSNLYLKLAPSWKTLLQVIKADWSWYWIDGAIDDSTHQPIDWNSLASEGGGHPDSLASKIAQFFHASIDSKATLDQQGLSAIESWIEQMPDSNNGLLCMCDQVMLQVIRGKLLKIKASDKKQVLNENDLKVWVRLKDSIDRAAEGVDPKSSDKVDNQILSLRTLNRAYDMLLNGKDTNEINQYLSQEIKVTRDASSMIDKARLQELLDEKSQRQAMATYRKLASGIKTGSDLWFESRLSIVRCLQRQGELKQATEACDLTSTIAGELPNVWKLRLERLRSP